MNDSTTSDLAKKNNQKRFNKSALIYALSLGTGLIAGIAIILSEDETVNLSSNFLIVATVLMTVFMYVLTWVWYKSMDEFEQQSFNQAGNVAFHTGFLALPWLILHEFNILPELDAFVLVFTMSIVFAVYYYGKKFI